MSGLLGPAWVADRSTDPPGEPASGEAEFAPWPTDLGQRYRQAGYWQGQTLGDWFRALAVRFGDRTAVVAGAERLGYAELDARSDRLTHRLGRLGIGPGDRVVVQFPNRVGFFPLILALFRIGALPVFALPAHRSVEIGHLLRLTGASAYVIADRFAGFDYRDLARDLVGMIPGLRLVLVDGEPQEFTALEGPEPDRCESVAVERSAQPYRPAADHVAFLNLSGGSTGLPKLIPRTHDDYLYSVRASADICGLSESSVYLCVLPVAHNFSLSSPGVLGVLHAGGCVVLGETPDPAAAFAVIEAEGVTITALVPPLAKLWLEAAAGRRSQLSSLRVLQVGGARLSDEIAARVNPSLGCSLQQVFGMAEGLVNYTRLDDPVDLVVGSQGRPISPADEVRIVDDADRDLPDGQLGHLLTRGPYTIRGYYRADEHNRRAFTADGFYRTGDLVRRLPSGHLVVEGRAKDQINRGGEKIAVEEVENHLLAHPEVFDVAVVAVPDPALGERSCAIVVPRGAALTVGEIRAFVRGRGLAEFKVPDQVRFVDAFPTTGVGKISKVDLRRLLAEQLAGSAPLMSNLLERHHSRREITGELDAARRSAVLEPGPPPFPELADPWRLHVLDPTGMDARLVTEWMSRPHVERFWEQGWPEARWRQELQAQLDSDFSRPYLVLREGSPFAYIELYRAARDVVARHYPAEPEDVGLHIAIGDPELTDRGLGRRFSAALITALRAGGPVRLLVDPDERHQQARAWALGAGFRLLDTVDLGHKRAALLIHDH